MEDFAVGFATDLIEPTIPSCAHLSYLHVNIAHHKSSSNFAANSDQPTNSLVLYLPTTKPPDFSLTEPFCENKRAPLPPTNFPIFNDPQLFRYHPFQLIILIILSMNRDICFPRIPNPSSP